jgi:hypothetical protein
MSAFYQKAIGWKTQMLGPEMGDYALVIQLRSVAHRRRDGGPTGARGPLNALMMRLTPTPAGWSWSSTRGALGSFS